MKVTDGGLSIPSRVFVTLSLVVLSLPVIVTVIVSPAPIAQFSALTSLPVCVIPLLSFEIVTSLTVTSVGTLSVKLNVPFAIPSFLIVIVYVTSFSSPLI